MKPFFEFRRSKSLDKSACKFFAFLILAIFGGNLAQGTPPNPPKEVMLLGSRYPQETVSEDSIAFTVTVHSDLNVAAGTYLFDFGANFTAHNLVVGDKGKFQSSSNGVVSKDGYTITLYWTYTEPFEIWDSNLTGSHLTYMETQSFIFNLYPNSYGSAPIWSQQVDMNDFWYWDYEGGWEVGFHPDTWNIRAPVNSTASYSINLPGMQPTITPDKSPIPCPLACSSCSSGPPAKMAAYSFDQLRAGLVIRDTPISYQPAYGPNIAFTTTYDQYDLGQAGGPPVAGFGPFWNYSALSYIIGEPVGVADTVSRFVPNGGLEVYNGFQVSSIIYTTAQTQFYGSFAPERNSQAVLSWDPVNQAYTRAMPDGSYEIYNYKITGSDGTPYFLISSQTDPQGNVVTYSYDGQNRLSAITDAMGQQTTFSYANSNPLLITKVTDPFGRSVSFTYDSSGRLQSATDPIGVVSLYGYDSTNFLNSLTTPYGTTTFSTDSDSNHQGTQATNPLGQTERVELRYNSPSGVSDTDTVPSANGLLATGTSGLSQNNTYYWDRKQYSSSLDYTQATITHWMTGPSGLTNIIDSQKKPLEGRVWYTYQGQLQADVVNDSVLNLPTVTARILDSGASQDYYDSYSDQGLVTKTIDPVGRTTNYTYAANGIDLTQITQVDGGGQDTLSTMVYDTIHLPTSVTDASGQTTQMTYNGLGQMLTRTDAKNETTTLAYNSAGYLASVTGPVTGAITTYTYDSIGRVQTVTDSEGYELIFAYDNIDRPISTTYPDGTTDLTSYRYFDVASTTDRQGRVTSNQYDAIRELISTTDPLGRTTQYGWCTCGGLATLTDPNGNVTTWNNDLEGRVTSKVYAGNTGTITYQYESTTSRLHSMSDAAGHGALYAYNNDNTLASVAYTPSSTPGVSFTYDPVYNRVLTMADGTGTTTYQYNPITGSTTTGAGRLASVSVPIAGSSATVAYTYDQLGRVVGRSVDGATTNANNVSTTFDVLGRVTNVSNALGAFVYSYVDTTSRLAEVTYPNWQKTYYSYFGNTGDQRLQEIKNYVWGMTSNTPLSDFQYTYNPVGTIATWQQQTDSNTPTQYALGYDAADQLTSAVQTTTGTGAPVSSNQYAYDPAGNRLAETTPSAVMAGQFNALNQLTSYSNVSGTQTIAGYTSAAVTGVTVNAVPATVSNSTNFSASVPLPAGTNVVSVVAKPASGSATTQRYQIVASGTAGTSLIYDADGNTLTDENGNSYQWDALNRLTKITYPSGAYTFFSYDGLSRRTQIVEENASNTVTSTKNYLWIGQEMAEERNASNQVTKRFFPQGEQQSGTSYYYTRDHLGSVREMLNSSGSIATRYSYDPYGKTTLVSGPNIATKQYANYYHHINSNLDFTKYREYDLNTGRWISKDPLQDAERTQGPGLYEYVSNDPIYKRDPLGLAKANFHAQCEKTGNFEVQVVSTNFDDAFNFISSLKDIPGDWRTFKCQCEFKCCYHGLSSMHWEEAFSQATKSPEGRVDAYNKVADILSNKFAGIKDDKSTLADTYDATIEKNAEEAANERAEREYNEDLSDFVKKCSETCKR